MPGAGSVVRICKLTQKVSATLPRELRDEIYGYLFEGLEISHKNKIMICSARPPLWANKYMVSDKFAAEVSR